MILEYRYLYWNTGIYTGIPVLIPVYRYFGLIFNEIREIRRLCISGIYFKFEYFDIYCVYCLYVFNDIINVAEPPIRTKDGDYKNIMWNKDIIIPKVGYLQFRISIQGLCYCE